MNPRHFRYSLLSFLRVPLQRVEGLAQLDGAEACCPYAFVESPPLCRASLFTPLQAGPVGELAGIVLHVVKLLAAILVTSVGPVRGAHLGATAMDGEGAFLHPGGRVTEDGQEAGTVKALGSLETRRCREGGEEVN